MGGGSYGAGAAGRSSVADGRPGMLANLDPILVDLALLFGLCVAVGVLFHRLRIPPVVGFLFAGALIGPNAFAVVGHRELVDQLAEVGAVVLLFSVGLELSMATLSRNVVRSQRSSSSEYRK